MRVVGGVVAVAGALLALTGCGSLAPASTYTPSVTAVPSTISSPTLLVPAPTPTATATPTETSAPADQCPDDSLGIAIRDSTTRAPAGSKSFDLLFANTGGTSCVLRGTPSVAVVDADGHRIGPAADQDGGSGHAIRIDVGETLVAVLRVTDIDPDGGSLGAACSVVHGAGYRVVPPHSTRRFPVDDTSAVACEDGPVFMSVGPLTRQ